MDQNTPQPQTLEEIQLKIASTLGISDLSDDKQKEIIEKATEVLLKKIFLQIVEQLSEEDEKTYMELLDKESSPEDIDKFLTEKIPNHNDNIEKMVEEFITEMKAAANTPT